MYLRKYRPFLTNPRFLLLWMGSFISGIGDAVAVVVIIWTIYNQTVNPLLITAALICLEFPAILLGPVWGVYIDRSPKVYIVMANLIRGCLFLYLLFIPLHSTVNYILFLGLLCISSSLAPITKAGENMIVPQLVSKDQLVTANSLMYIQFDLALVVGPLIGGLIASKDHISTAFLLNAITFFIAAICLAYVFPKSTVINEIEKTKQTLREKFDSWSSEFKAGISFIAKNANIASLVMISFLWNLLIWGTSPTLLPIFNKIQLLSDATGYGLLGAATSFGIILGSFIIGSLKIEKNQLQIVMFSIILHGTVYACLYLTPNLWVAVVLFLLSGVISAPAMIYMRTIIQQHVPEEKLGRIFTVLSSVGAFGFPIGTTLASSFVALYGERSVSFAFLTFGAFLSVIVLILSVAVTKKRKEINHVQHF